MKLKVLISAITLFASQQALAFITVIDRNDGPTIVRADGEVNARHLRHSRLTYRGQTAPALSLIKEIILESQLDVIREHYEVNPETNTLSIVVEATDGTYQWVITKSSD